MQPLNSILWYDYETFSANPSTGRIAQFAAIRTDERLEPVGEPIELFCKPSHDCLPDPVACLITGITPQQVEERGLPEPEFADRVRAAMGEPGTCISGFNSIRFDDNYTRFLFWRNFIDPYAHEWANGNSRWDLLDVARYTYALRPEGIEWPQREDGAPSFRLEHLTRANGLPHLDAHDALSDVRATIALARLIRERQPRLFDYAYALRGKNAVRDLLVKEQGRPLLHTSGMFPAIHGHTTAIAILGAHPRIQNRLIVADLRQDPQQLLETPPEQLLELLFARGEDLPEGVERPAIKELHLNRAPLLAPLRVLDEAGAGRLGLDLAACERHFDFIQAHREAFEALARGLYASEPAPRPLDAEAALYQGFVPDADRQRLLQVRALAPEKLAELQQLLQDSRLRELMFRYRARNFPASLAADERTEWHDLLGSRLLHEEGGAGMWAEKFFASIEERRADPSSTGREWLILDQVENWGRGLLAEAGVEWPA
ncbi:MAG TPA: exodeoxyribonuclease I [Chromatiales bacterium]|nr:exodeoxyribonuclease I [Chromatiales bacterium]